MSDGYDKFVRGVHATLLLLGVLALTLLCLWLWHLDVAARQVPPVLTDARRTIVILGGTATNLEKTLAIERQAASAQIATAQQAAASLAAAAAAANKLIARTDESLNGQQGVLPALAGTIRDQQDRFAKLEGQAAVNLADLDVIEQRIEPGIDHFNAASLVLASELPPILENVQAATAQTVTIAANTADTTHQIDLTSQDIRAFVHRETAPVRGTWNVIKEFLFQIAGPASSVAQAAK